MQTFVYNFMRKQFILLLVIILPNFIVAQKIDNLVAFRAIKSDSYFRFNYENDYFTSTDENYTQGYNLELVLPIFKKNPINNLFYKPKNSLVKYGLALEHIGFTPDNYELTAIQYNDRPFASAIMLKSFIIANNIVQKSSFTSSFSIGIIGPGAFGKEMQVGIHEATGNAIPQGWRNQIKNDAVINYEIGYEKQLVRLKDIFSLQTTTSVKVGSLHTNASLGLNATLGIINNAFNTSKDKFNFYFYAQPVVSVVGYDATLQGGLFNKKSPYVIADKEINRLTAQYNYGFILKTKTLYFEYSRSSLTREFKSGNAAKWGGIKIGFTF